MARPTWTTDQRIAAYVVAGHWAPRTMVDAFDDYAERLPEREALVDSRARLTWAEVRELSDALAGDLASAGVGRDEVLVVQLPNGTGNALLRVALKKAGIVGAYAPVVWRGGEVGQVVRALKATGLVVPRSFRGFEFPAMAKELLRDAPMLRHVLVAETTEQQPLTLRELSGVRFGGTGTAGPAVLPPPPGSSREQLRERRFAFWEVSVIAISSGSTGTPKLCEWPEAMQMLLGRGHVERLRLTGEDVIGVFAPLGGGAGAMTWLCAAQVPARVVLTESFAPEALLRVIEQERVTFLSTVPAILIRLLQCPELGRHDLRSLRVIRTGTAALSPAAAAEAERLLGCPVVPAAGSMEMPAFAHTSLDDPRALRLDGGVGRPLPGGEATVLDEHGQPVPFGEVGELRVRGAYAASGYYQDVEGTRAVWGERAGPGWIRTGDLARLDAQGNIVIVGRIKDVIVRGGRKIYPLELERLLLQHPKVAEAAIVGVPHAVLGETVGAVVIPKPGVALAPDEVRAFLDGWQIAAYKLPERVEVVSEFPRLDSEKVDRRALARRLAGA